MKKKIGMIIQARMSSKRFPGKVMKRILNIPMIYRIYERVILCRKLDDVIVAIPSSKSDDKLEIFLKKKRLKLSEVQKII